MSWKEKWLSKAKEHYNKTYKTHVEVKQHNNKHKDWRGHKWVKRKNMAQIDHTNSNHKIARVAISVSGKIDFKTRTITRDKEEILLMKMGQFIREK